MPMVFPGNRKRRNVTKAFIEGSWPSDQIAGLVIRRPRVPSWPLAEFVTIREIHRFLYPWWHLSPRKQPAGSSPVSWDFVVFIWSTCFSHLLAYYYPFTLLTPTIPQMALSRAKMKGGKGSHHSATLATPMKIVNSTITRRLLARWLVDNYGHDERVENLNDVMMTQFVFFCLSQFFHGVRFLSP